jgi:OOP family OmpA-OmpF porin
MSKIYLIFLFEIFCFGLQAQTNANNCKDHPIITRYPAAIIEYCDEQIYKEFHIAKGDEVGYQKIEDWVKVAGKNNRIYYSIKGDRTVSEVYKNYLEALKNGSFNLMANQLHAERNVSNKIGGATWLSTFYKSNPFPTNVGIRVNQGSGTVGGTFYIAGNLETPSGKVYVVVSGKQYTDNEVVVLVDIIEVAAVEDDFIKVDANYLFKKLQETGHVAVDGILFDFNKATIKSESEAILAEIGQLIKSHPEINVYVVGHTDMIGEFQYNLDLSIQRANAVVNYLIENYKIPADRIIPHGVGPLAPVATNLTDDGRTKNRRVELVLRFK